MGHQKKDKNKNVSFLTTKKNNKIKKAKKVPFL